MITIKAENLEVGYVICKRAGGRFFKIVSVVIGEEVSVKYDNNMIEVFKKTHELKVRK